MAYIDKNLRFSMAQMSAGNERLPTIKPSPGLTRVRNFYSVLKCQHILFGNCSFQRFFLCGCEYYVEYVDLFHSCKLACITKGEDSDSVCFVWQKHVLKMIMRFRTMHLKNKRKSNAMHIEEECILLGLRRRSVSREKENFSTDNKRSNL